MIVFTLTNDVTDDVWVGSAREGVTPEARFKQLQEALPLGIDHAFYRELKVFGPHSYSVELFAVAEDRMDLQQLVEEALDTYNGKSLVGITTVLPGATKAALNKPKPKPRPGVGAAPISSTSSSAAVSPATKRTVKPVKEKMASGRTGSAARERAIKAGIEAEKAAMAAAKAKRAQDEADEMKRIMASLDARGSTLSKR